MSNIYDRTMALWVKLAYNWIKGSPFPGTCFFCMLFQAFTFQGKLAQLYTPQTKRNQNQLQNEGTFPDIIQHYINRSKHTMRDGLYTRRLSKRASMLLLFIKASFHCFSRTVFISFMSERSLWIHPDPPPPTPPPGALCFFCPRGKHDPLVSDDHSSDCCSLKGVWKTALLSPTHFSFYLLPSPALFPRSRSVENKKESCAKQISCIELSPCPFIFSIFFRFTSTYLISYNTVAYGNSHWRSEKRASNWSVCGLKSGTVTPGECLHDRTQIHKQTIYLWIWVAVKIPTRICASFGERCS